MEGSSHLNGQDQFATATVVGSSLSLVTSVAALGVVLCEGGRHKVRYFLRVTNNLPSPSKSSRSLIALAPNNQKPIFLDTLCQRLDPFGRRCSLGSIQPRYRQGGTCCDGGPVLQTTAKEHLSSVPLLPQKGVVNVLVMLIFNLVSRCLFGGIYCSTQLSPRGVFGCRSREGS
jgi:hypothetical protein